MNASSSWPSTLPVGFWGVFMTIALTAGSAAAARNSLRSSRHVRASRSSRSVTNRGTRPKMAACDGYSSWQGCITTTPSPGSKSAQKAAAMPSLAPSTTVISSSGSGRRP